jgi:hypothetical protein
MGSPIRGHRVTEEVFCAMKDSPRDLYKRLGASPSATTAELRMAFRARARGSHPDIAGSNATDDMASINEAWAVLGDSRRRAEYDRSLGRPPAPPRDFTGDGEPPWSGKARPSAGMGRPTQRLLRTFLVVSVLSAMVLMVAIFLVGFGRVGT